MPPPDAPIRARALDIHQSFLVQAPAGSGKTELLTQRFLALLATVDNPESIVAITFTRKAAGEMRSRISGALQLALGPEPDKDHARTTWSLARAALQRNQTLAWGLLENPSRLRILTLDGLCSSLASQMPWLSQTGGHPVPADDPDTLHREAALRTLALLEQDSEYRPALQRLLLHLDNNLTRAAELMMNMLARRDQWLRHTIGGLDRARLEQSLAAISTAALERLIPDVPPEAWDLFAYAGNPLPDDDLARHQALADFLLTKEGESRKTVNKNHGFPAGDPRKAEMIELCQSLPPSFVADLLALRSLPPPNYSDAQWAIIEALVDVLHLAVAQLTIVFQERRATDFCELTLSALRALGTDAEPTPLAYSLDFRIHHLLIDEFQDTSRSKLALLERITAEWTPGDGRTVFAVGDPMQSIYSFQEADVSLFTQCRARGLGRLPLESLVLSANFRSTRNLIDWFNAAFPGVLAPEDDPTSGAISYSPSHAQCDPLPGDPVVCHPVPADAEAAAVADVVQQCEGEVAILVRRRADAFPIVAELKRRGVGFQAVEMDPLAERSIIQDLRALTRALLHPADRLAWLSVLRAPWCGLELADLATLAASDSIPDAIRQSTLPRLLRPAAVLLEALDQSRRRPLRRHVELTWRALGGPACLRDAAEQEDARVFFTLLDKLDTAGDLPEFQLLDDELGRLCAAPDPNAPKTIQVMTMHKSKGLEFDNVILPGLSNKPRTGSTPLLRWAEFEDLVVGCIRETGADRDPVYDYLGVHDRLRQHHEAGRLLYVAATRAKKRLHLFGNQASSGSFLARLAHIVGDAFAAPQAPGGEPARDVPKGVPLRRVPADFVAPAPPPPLAWRVVERHVEEAGESTAATAVGTLVHRVLQLIAQQGVDAWTPDRIADRAPAFRAQLMALGVPHPEIPAATTRTVEVLNEALRSERGRWILTAHEESVCEWELSAVAAGEIRTGRLDRSFVADGIRWIIDYKTGGDHPDYRAQLEQYAAMVARLDPRPIHLGLYFPLSGDWIEWPATFAQPAGSATGPAAG
jgi:ATP-dependent exoDNAse (exonuclease V) beta subunit